MIAIGVAATKSYLYAWQQCLRSIAATAAHETDVHFILATDESDEGKRAEIQAKQELPEGWKVTVIRLAGMEGDSKDYKEAAQMRIAALQGALFSFARAKVRADLFLSVESDTVLPANALRVLQWTLQMPKADGSPLYDIAAGTYPNGLFLGGFGSPQNPIAEDFLPNERKLPRRLMFLLEESKKRGDHERYARLMQKAKKCPPDGNIWEVTAKHGWRRRGWMDFAYPGIGEGAVVPSDWCGLGCTLMSKHALALADFAGYDGRGTQDLFLCWHRWHPAGLRIACVPHVVCDHIKRDGEKIVHYRAYHEQNPDYKGHLRVRKQDFCPV
jgi:hypothetical protein